jgi:hypothetical protein
MIMPLLTLLPAPSGATALTSTTTSVLRHLDAAVLTDLLTELLAAPHANAHVDPHVDPLSAALTAVQRMALLAEGRDGQRVSGTARHLLDTTDAHLLVVTADQTRPPWVDALESSPGAPGAAGSRVSWCSSADLATAVDAALTRTGAQRLGEQSRTLLGELLDYWEAHGLRSLHDTVVVAGRSAWPEYLRTGAVISPAGRELRGGTTHVGFFVDDAISEVVPAIRGSYRSVTFTPASADQHRRRGDTALASVIDASLAHRTRTEGGTYAVLLLSEPTAAETVQLDRRVQDDATTPTGRRTPWTVSQRYTHLARLRAGVTGTSEL